MVRVDVYLQHPNQRNGDCICARFTCLSSGCTDESIFHPLEVVSRYRDPQLQEDGNVSTTT